MGIVIEVRAVQTVNDEDPIFVTVVGIKTSTIVEQK